MGLPTMNVALFVFVFFEQYRECPTHSACQRTVQYSTLRPRCPWSRAGTAHALMRCSDSVSLHFMRPAPPRPVPVKTAVAPCPLELIAVSHPLPLPAHHLP